MAKKKNVKGAFGNRLKTVEAAEPVETEPATISKKALRQQRQRANAQKRKVLEAADGSATEAKRRKGVNMTSIVVPTLGAAAFREQHCIEIDGENLDPFETFDDAKSQLGKALVKQMNRQGYTKPTPIQAETWPLALQGYDIVAVAETGSGKTCGFLLPTLARIAERGPFWNDESLVQPKALVLAPTRELVQQIRLEANVFLVGPVDTRPRVVAVFGGADKKEQICKLKKGADVVIATPGRLLDLSSSDTKKQWIALNQVTYLVLDEADRMLDMGFEADLRQIVERCPRAGRPEEGGGASGPRAGSRRQTLLFTATWPEAVQEYAASLTASNAVHVRIGQISRGDGLTLNSRVSQFVSIVEENYKASRLKEVLASELRSKETAIVFAATKDTCDRIEMELQNSTCCAWCAVLHSGKDQKERNSVLRRFRDATCDGKDKHGRGVLIATDVASRGLHIPGVALVVIYDFQGGLDSYVHRIGRTGRSGKSGRAFTFFTSEDEGAAELVNFLQAAGQDVNPELAMIASSTQRSARGRGKGSARGRVPGRGRGY